jgi:hypothetical protein
MSLQKKIEKVMCFPFPGFWLQAFKELLFFLFPRYPLAAFLQNGSAKLLLFLFQTSFCEKKYL